MSTDSVAQDQIRAFVDRILRLKEEAKNITDDIKEVYAEAKGNGFDKTQLGKLVNYVEKRAKDPNAVSEGEAIFGLYLAAYDGASLDAYEEPSSHTHAYAREDEPEHDAETGEVIEPAETLNQAPMVVYGDSGAERRLPRASLSTFHPAGNTDGERDGADLPPAATHPHAKATEDNAATAEPLDSEATAGRELQVGGGEPRDSSATSEKMDVTAGETAPHSKPEAASAGMEGEADRQPIPDISKPNPICRDPDDCGVYASWHMPCLNCQRAAALRSAA